MNGRTEVPEEFRPTAAGPGASNKQISFLASLLADRELPDEARAAMEVRLEAQINANEERGDSAPCEAGITKRRASDFIERLKALPRRPNTGSGIGFSVQYSEMELDDGKVRRVGQLVIPGEPPRWLLAGRYALETPGPEHRNEVTFYHLKIGDRYGWWLNVMASDEEHEVTDFGSKCKILNAIADDPLAASVRYGHEFERCGVCGRGLTADESRERGIGPVCASRLGY